ncbi:hypothetical protein OsI_23109 [Oryza sativa Indica Group]|uniref:Transposase MuDR plant domain-containing protein n=1 Tax=Oryza sativa subsp. indica TaxID=39946 RepID=B8B2V5_ORYSI|nr:hypothetical protein OsI_23109 [Oryza sativa Indica Group]
MESALHQPSKHSNARVLLQKVREARATEDAMRSSTKSKSRASSCYSFDRPACRSAVMDPRYIQKNNPRRPKDPTKFLDQFFVPYLSDCKAKFWKKAKGSQLKGKEIVVRNSDGEEVSTDDEDLQLPDSDDDGEVRLKFKAFMAEDVKNPVFKVGMVFPSVEVLRKAITEYSLKARVDIKMPRNEQKRLRAHCVEGCPWNLYASFDSRSKSMMVKTYLGEHKCQKEWVLKRCTAKWLSEKYIETFRANDQMTLGGFCKVNGPEVKPPIYEKKVGRPPKSRRKAPHEVQGKNGSKMSKHGVEMHCSYCKEPGHNKKGCPLRKAGLRPKLKTSRIPAASSTEEWHESEQEPAEVLTQSQSAYDQLLSQVPNPMVAQMFEESSQGDTIAGVDWDDVVANPISELPKVLSPRKMSTADRKVPNKQDDSDSDGSLEDDPDFVDSDYDISDADDDLYVDNVDVGVEDLSDCKAKFWKKAKGSQLKGKEIVVRNSDGEEVSTDDEDLQLLDFDDDGEVRLKV